MVRQLNYSEWFKYTISDVLNDHNPGGLKDNKKDNYLQIYLNRLATHVS